MIPLRLTSFAAFSLRFLAGSSALVSVVALPTAAFADEPAQLPPASAAQPTEVPPPPTAEIATTPADSVAPQTIASRPAEAAPSAPSSEPTTDSSEVAPPPAFSADLAPVLAPSDNPGRPRLTVDGGIRMTIVKDSGFDPYATNDVLPGLSASAGLLPFDSGRMSFGFGAEYTFGGHSALARGANASLTVHHVSLGLVGRYAVGERFALGARVAPGLDYLIAGLKDDSSDRPLDGDAFTWVVDATLGLSLTIAKPDANGAMGVYFVADAGYIFAGKADMVLTPEADEEEPRNFGSTTLPRLRPGGFTNRFALSVSFR